MNLLDKIEDETILVKYFLELVDYIEEESGNSFVKLGFSLNVKKLKHLAKLCYASSLYNAIPPISDEIQKILKVAPNNDEAVNILWKFLHLSLVRINNVGYCYALIVQVIPAIHLLVHKQQALEDTKYLMTKLFTEGKYD